LSLFDGDLVSTPDNGTQPIVWVRSRIVDLTRKSNGQRPILISAGSLDSEPPAGTLSFRRNIVSFLIVWPSISQTLDLEIFFLPKA
jgi:hypothetical protein